MTRILIVEDEQSYLDPLLYQLTREGYEAYGASTGEEGWALYEEMEFDLVLLDLMLPGVSGTTLCRRMRELRRVPIIMVTAKSAENDVIVGLEIGADDYVTKPYSFRELLARIHAVLRRSLEGQDEGARADAVRTLSCGPVEMSVASHEVHVRGKLTAFPLKEFEVLEYLLRNKGHVLTRHQLIARVWGSDYVGDTKTLDVHVKRIRAKIEDDPAHPALLTTVRGVGYRIGE
ncbi:transcriptional regulator [Bifidobacterium italicum]|uniref:Sensory transduction protein RegX3 n=1 Tax=Bifidobacterium italicum TaxID=1960968 RepID=A0A2A2EMX6_9BIFI|nr:response regulator transcription factor [Bifidobacterium italicum]PAU70185.1 transcriptional regulator [Bifidobacterium italicum]